MPFRFLNLPVLASLNKTSASRGCIPTGTLAQREKRRSRQLSMSSRSHNVWTCATRMHFRTHVGADHRDKPGLRKR